MSVIISPPPVPSPADPASLTIYHQQLAAYCLALLDEVAAIIPRLEETIPTQAGSGSGHPSVPSVFLGSAIDPSSRFGNCRSGDSTSAMACGIATRECGSDTG